MTQGRQGERLLLIRERRFLLGLMAVTGLVAFWLVRGYVAWAIVGLILGYVCLPLQRKLAARTKRPVLSASLVVTLVVLIVTLPLALLVYSVASDVSSLVGNIHDNGLPAFLQGALVKVLPDEMAASLSVDIAQRLPGILLELAPEVITAGIDATVGVFILGSALFAVLTKEKEIVVWLRRVVPMRRDREDAFFAGFTKALDAVIYGVVVVAGMQALVGGLLWWAAGLPSVPFWTGVTFVFSMIPALGPSLVLVPGAIYALATGNTVGAVILLVGTVVGIGIIDYIVRPIIIKKKGDLDPTLTLLSIVGGVATMGIIGIFVGPIVVAVFLQVTELTMSTHAHFGGDYDQELFEPADPIVGEPPVADAAAQEPA